MITTIWGSRGSLATPGAATLGYGGNTSCVELRLDDGSTVVLDAGTGIRELGLRLANRPRAPINLLLTHLHLDHLAGLPFFAPLWDDRAELHIWAPFARADLAEALARYMSPPLFPVSISDVPASVTFHDLPEPTWRLGSAHVFSERVRHVGPTVGYRIEDAGRSLAYLPDHEPYSVGEPDDSDRLSGYGLAATRRSSSMTPSTSRRNTRLGSGGGIRALPTPSPLQARHARSDSCSSTTIPCTPTTT